MGTSLSGLTPATTFDGLLKVGDNDPLTATLKPISTGDGTDTILQLSNSALQIGGATTIVSDNTGSDNLFEITQSGNNNNNSFAIYNSNTVTTPVYQVGYQGGLQTRIQFYSNITFRPGGVSISEMTTNEVRIGGGSGARLAVKGSGATSATTSLLVQNSAGSDILTIKDDRSFKISSGAGTVFNIDSAGTQTIGTSSRATSFNGSQTTFVRDVGIGETTPTARLHVKAGTTQDTIARFQDPLQTWSYIDIKNDSVLTDYTGIFWGSKAKIRSKEVGPVFIDCAGGVSFLDGNSAKSNINSQGAIAIGASSVPSSTQAYIKGSGATSATTALLVQNSAGTGFFKYRDDGLIQAKNPASNSSTFFQLLNGNGNSLFKVLANGTILAESLPTSAAGLPVGAIYNDAGTLKIV